MKKLHLLAFYALVMPAITLGPGILLAAQNDSETADIGEQSMGQDAEPGTQSSQQGQGAVKSRYNTGKEAGETGALSDKQSQTYLASLPTGGMVASDLIGADVSTTDSENAGNSAGRISDLLINRNGRVEAVLVSAGQLLGLGQQLRAVDWNAIQMSGPAGDQSIRVNMTRDDLQAVPVYENAGDRRPKAPSNLRVE